MAATSRWGSTSTSVETSSPFSFRYSRVLRRLEMSFLVGFMARTSTVKPFACQDSKLLRSDSGMLPGHGLPLPGAGHRDGGAGNAPRGPGATVARAGRARLSVEPVLSSEARRRGSQARRRPLARRPAPPAVHDEGRAEAGSGRPSAVGHAAGRSVRRLPARPHDVRDDRTAARVSRHARRLVRLLPFLRALAVGVRDPAIGHGHGRVLLRPVDRLLVGVLRGAGHRLSRLSRRRVRATPAHSSPAHVSEHRARLHAVGRALPGRAGAQEGHRPRGGNQDPNHVAHARAGRLDPGDEGEDRSGVRRQGVRSSRAHRDRRVGLRVRRPLRAHPRPRGLLLSRSPRRGRPAGEAGRQGRAGLHQPLPQGGAGPGLPAARSRPARRPAVPVRAHAGRVRGRRAGPPRRHEEGPRDHRLPAAHRGDRARSRRRRRVPDRLPSRRRARRHPGPHRSSAGALRRRVPGTVSRAGGRLAHRSRHPRDRRGDRARRAAPLGSQGQARQGRAHRSPVLGRVRSSGQPDAQEFEGACSQRPTRWGGIGGGVSPPPMFMIGARIPRLEDHRFLTGRARYVADLDRPRLLHVAFLRSPHAHARIARVDARPALAQPGVVACWTAQDLRGRVKAMQAPSRMRSYRPTEWPALADGKVRYAGEAVAALVAESRYAAEDAADTIVVEYEPLGVASDPEAAMGADAALVHESAGSNVLLTRTFSQGDVAAAFRDAALVVGDRFRFHRHAGVTMESRACLADTERGTLTLWSSTQIPGILRDVLADLLTLPTASVRVVAPDVGGGFGVKGVVYPEELVVSALARALGRPVRWIGDRREDLMTTTQAWDEVIDAELAVDRDGRIAGLRAKVVADIGAYSIYPWTASIEIIQVVSFLPGPYRVSHYHAEAFGVATNKTPMGPYRGVGRPVSVFVTESLLDSAARRLGLDPAEIRRRNLLRAEDLPYRSPSGITWDSGAFHECLELACKQAGYDDLRVEQARGRKHGRMLGVGLAAYVELTGVGSAIPVSPGADIATGTEGATVRVEVDGGVTAIFAVACHGQGHET